MRYVLRPLLSLLFLLLAPERPRADTISTFVAEFTGPSRISRHVANLFRLELWRGLRAADDQGMRVYGTGEVIWGGLQVQNFAEAEEAARGADILAQVVLFGSVRAYGDGAIVRTLLAIPKFVDFRDQRHEQWRVSVTFGGRVFQFVVDLPQRRYSFALGVISSQALRAYISTEYLPMYSQSSGGNITGRLRLERRFRALRASEDAVYVDQNGARGWVRVRPILTTRIEAADFLTALIRIFRADWAGAPPYLARVRSNPNTPHDIRVDTLLMEAFCLEREGRSGIALVDEAEILSPFSERVAVYSLIM